MSAKMDPSNNITSVLLADLNTLAALLKTNDTQTLRRAYARSLFALIEGMIYSLKGHINSSTMMSTLTREEREFLLESKLDLTLDRRVISRPLHIPFANNVDMLFKLVAKLDRSDFAIDKGSAGWNSFKEALRIRNRITHPKSIKLLIISDKEMHILYTCTRWFWETYQSLLQAGLDSLQNQSHELQAKIAGRKLQNRMN